MRAFRGASTPSISSFSQRNSSLRTGCRRITTWLFFFLLGAVILLLLFRFLCIPLLIYIFPSLDPYFFDLAAFGPYPERHYRSFDLTSPQPRTPRWTPDVCDRENESGGLVLLDLHGTGVSHKGPTVLDLKGNLIWTNDSFGQHAMNLRVQRWKEHDYLTFWAGNHDDRGFYYMLDEEFEVAYNVSAVGEGLWGDPHEFTITKDDTALLLVYNHTHVDLSSTHMTDIEPFIVDAVIQEVDIESGELLFQWVASEHFDDGEYIKTTYDTHLYPLSYEDAGPHDYFHMNSVDKDSDGNYLVSIRHTHSVICVSGDTGQILWGLGGAGNDFEDLSSGEATGFQWQHDARWIDEANGILGLFDNAIAERHWYDAPHSTGKIIHLDIANKTAELLHSYKSAQSSKSTSQGSFQYLAGSGTNDRVFIGWGSVPAYTIHDAETEELLCETHYAASLLQYYEFAKSYRTYRAPADWTARPKSWDPSAIVDGRNVYVSWNGGMEVRWWALEKLDGKNANDEQWSQVERIPRDGFESRFQAPDDEVQDARYRIAALDADGNFLRYSNTFDLTSTGSSLTIWIPLAGFVVLVAALIYVFYSRERRSRFASWLPIRKGARGSPRYTMIDGEDDAEYVLDTRPQESNGQHVRSMA